MRSVTLATIAVAALLLSASAATAAPSFVLRGDTRIGTFAVQTDGSPAGAIRAFGTPRLRRTGEACTATWIGFQQAATSAGYSSASAAERGNWVATSGAGRR